MASTYASNVTAAAAEAIPGRVGRKGLLIHNIGAKTAYLGDRADLTSANGFPILSGDRLELVPGFAALNISAPLNAICAAAESTELRVWDFA